jgi:hypothetical protein
LKSQTNLLIKIHNKITSLQLHQYHNKILKYYFCNLKKTRGKEDPGSNIQKWYKMNGKNLENIKIHSNFGESGTFQMEIIMLLLYITNFYIYLYHTKP